MACFQRRLRTHYRPSDHLNYQFKWCPTHIYIPQPHLSSGRVIQPSRKSENTVYITHILHYIYMSVYMVFWIKTFLPTPRFRISFSLTHPNHGHLFYLSTRTYSVCLLFFFSFFRIIIWTDVAATYAAADHDYRDNWDVSSHDWYNNIVLLSL